MGGHRAGLLSGALFLGLFFLAKEGHPDYNLSHCPHLGEHLQKPSGHPFILVFAAASAWLPSFTVTSEFWVSLTFSASFLLGAAGLCPFSLPGLGEVESVRLYQFILFGERFFVSIQQCVPSFLEDVPRGDSLSQAVLRPEAAALLGRVGRRCQRVSGPGASGGPESE